MSSTTAADAGSRLVVLDEDWLQLVSGQGVGHLHGVVQTADGSVWIQNAEDDPERSALLRCDLDGAIRDRLASDALPFPHGLEVFHHPRHGECLLQTDCQSGVSLMATDGRVHWRLAKPDFYRLHWTLAWKPSNCGIASDGRIYLADGYGSGFIVVLDADGRESGLFGGPRHDAATLVHPHGLAVVPYAGREVAIEEVERGRDVRVARPARWTEEEPDLAHHRVDELVADGDRIRFASAPELEDPA